MMKFLLSLALLVSATATLRAQLAITEVFPAASTNGLATLHADWWELTNFGTSPVDVSGYRFNDSNGGLTNGVVTIESLILEPGESVIFVEQNVTTGLPTAEDFRTWWGAALPEGLRIFTYGTNNIGLSGSGDTLRLWDPATTNENDPVALAEFGAATVGSSFTYGPATGVFGTVSIAGIDAAAAAAENGDVGSPGRTTGTVPLSITQQPEGAEVNPLSSVTLSVAANGMPRPRYQWRLNDSEIADATAARLTVTSVDATKTGTYRVTLRNSITTLESDPAEIRLSAQPSAPVFEQKPSNATNFLGGTVTFAAVATGVPPPVYQWYFKESLLNGETANTLVRSNLTLIEAGDYRVEVTNGSGTTNAVATLTVLPKPDLRITEVESSSALDADFLTVYGFSKQDWWELTSFESVPISLLGWRFDDNSATLANAYTITNDVVIGPGESVVFVEVMTADQFRTWWGPSNVPARVKIISYSGSGLGLSSGGDSLRVWNATATDNDDTVAQTQFGAADPGVSFNYNPDTGVFGEKSTLGVFGVFAAEAVAAGGQDIGSPGRIREGVLPPPIPVAVIVADGQQFFIEVLAQAGHTYQLQQRGGLASGAWQAVGASQTPTQDGVIRFGPLASLGIPSQYFQVLVE